MARSTNGGGDTGGNQVEAARQRRLLEAIQVLGFAANPTTVQPFGSLTLSWQVTLPSNLNFPVSIIVDGQHVGTSGTLAVTSVTQTEFVLAASSRLASVTLKALTITLDQSGCKSFPDLSTAIVTVPLQQQLDSRFSGSGSFTLRGSGTTVALFDGGVTVDIPLHLNIPDWFDADMDITFQLDIGMGAAGSVAVQPGFTNVHVTWTWFQDFAGCTSFGEQLSQAFMSDIVANEIAPRVAQQINSQLIQSFAATQQQSDPQHRPFVLTSFSFGTGGISFTLCPQ